MGRVCVEQGNEFRRAANSRAPYIITADWKQVNWVVGNYGPFFDLDTAPIAPDTKATLAVEHDGRGVVGRRRWYVPGDEHL